MDKTKLVQIGQVVIGLSGRDKGNILVITNIIDDKFVEIVDGKRRKLDKPKKKNIGHLQLTKTVIKEVQTRDTGSYQYNDAYIRKVLEDFQEKSGG